MEKVTYDKYASNLVRIKNITSEAQRDPNLRIANMITEPFEVKETLNLAKIWTDQNTFLIDFFSRFNKVC